MADVRGHEERQPLVQGQTNGGYNAIPYGDGSSSKKYSSPESGGPVAAIPPNRLVYDDWGSQNAEPDVLLSMHEHPGVPNSGPLPDTLAKDQTPSGVDPGQKKVTTTPATDYFSTWEGKRVRILLMVSIPAILPAITSTMYLPAINFVVSDLNTTEELVALTLSSYALAIGFCPLIWGAISDRYGRRAALIPTLFIFFCFALMAGFSPNVYWLIVARMFQAVGLSASGVVGSGCIADIYPPAIRGTAMGWFTVTVLLGPVIGPVLGGIIADHWGWRATFFLLGGIALFFGTFNFCFLPETLNPSGPKRSINPLNSLKLLLLPPIAIVAVMSCCIFCNMFLLLFLLPFQMFHIYGLTETQIGLTYLPFGLGALAGTIVGGRAADYAYSKRGTGGRLITPLFSGVGCSVGVFGFAITMEHDLFWGLFFTGVMGFFMTLGRAGISTFAIERCPHNAAAVSAAIYSFQWAIVFWVMSAISPLQNMFGFTPVFCGGALMILCSVVPGFFLMLRFLEPPKPLIK